MWLLDPRRRTATVSPLMGCPSQALPSAFHPSSVPVSKSRLSVLPSAPSGLMAPASHALRAAASSTGLGTGAGAGLSVGGLSFARWPSTPPSDFQVGAPGV